MVEIIYALKNTIISKPGSTPVPGSDPESIEYLKNLCQSLSRSCIEINKNGKFHENLDNSKFDINNGEYVFIIPCGELNALNKALFELFREEVCIFVYSYVFINVCIDTHIHVCMYVQVCMYSCICRCP